MKNPFTFFAKTCYVLIFLSTMESKLVSAQIAPVHAEHILPSFIGPVALFTIPFILPHTLIFTSPLKRIP